MILFQISTRRFSMWLAALMLLPRALSLQDFVFKDKSNFVLPLSALQLTVRSFKTRYSLALSEMMKYLTMTQCPAGSQQQSTSNEQENTLPIWEMKLSPGKGRGLFALEDIQKGTHILVEAPLLAVNPPALVPGMGYSLSAMAADVEHEYSRLSPEQQEEYLSCHEQRLEGDSQSESGRLMAILRSNAYNLQDGRVAIYPKVALINHSCQPNVLNADNDGTRVIVATRNIEKGEEVCSTDTS